MNWDKKITLARAVRNWDGGIAEVTLVWHCFYSKLGVEYTQVTDKGYDIKNSIPDHCVRNWLWIFVRPQEHLSKDSYCITQPVAYEWRGIINMERV
jgi:hypothetical protein